MLFEASRATTAFQRAAAEAASTDVARRGASGSGGDELLGDGSISLFFFF